MKLLRIWERTGSDQVEVLYEGRKNGLDCVYTSAAM
jgi:hypothetical protein